MQSLSMTNCFVLHDFWKTGVRDTVRGANISKRTAADYSLHGWFDRMADFSLGNSPNLCAETMPQVRTSRSLNNMNNGSSMVESKRDVKIGVVRAALRDIEDEKNPVATSENTSNKLDRFLKNLDADTD
jgi:hypothetical protein